MHDLTIATTHTFYVIAGNTPVLVHNSNAACVARNAKGQFTSGENSAAANGRKAHMNYRAALGDEYDYEVTLDNGKRADAVNWSAQIVRELKSDAPSSMATGRRQVAGYAAELERMTGQPWTGVLDTYSR
jgi:hypothetical protein